MTTEQLPELAPRHALPIVTALAAALAAALSPACTCHGPPPSEDEFPGLVTPIDDAPPAIDVERAARGEADAIAAAIGLSHRHVAMLLGSHRVRGTSEVVLVERGEPVETIADVTVIDYSDSGEFRATLENSHDYGRHAIWSGGHLYLRPRYGKYHKRLPSERDEPERVRNEVFSTLADYFEVVADSVEGSRLGEDEQDRRPVVKLALARIPTPPARRFETLAQRKWREGAVAEEVTGELWLDRETGVPLRAELHATVAFQREGEQFLMKLSASHEITDIGGEVAIIAPEPGETVTLAQRLTEVQERAELLDGIAPPAAKEKAP